MDNILMLKAQDINGILFNKEREIIEIIKKAYVSHYLGKSSLPHSVFLRFPNTNNRIIGLPAYLSMMDGEKAGLKWISSFPSNTLNCMERASAVIILNELISGRAKSILEGSIISAKRTAASATLAAKYMHSDLCETKLGIIGCGRINSEILAFLLSEFHSINQIILFDSTPDRSEQFASHTGLMYPSISVMIASSCEEVFSKTSLISIATTSGIPFIDDSIPINKNSTILDISLRDFYPSFVLKCDNIVDDVDHVCREKTSMELTEIEIGNRNFIRCSLSELIFENHVNRIPDKPSMFSPFGLGVLDLALADYVYSNARNNNIGTEIENFY